MKLNIKYFAFLLMICAFFSCSINKNGKLDYEKIADKITAETAKKLKKQKGLNLVGIGGQMMNDIQMMAMGFDYYQEVDLRAARKLIVPAVTEYLSAINNNKEIRPYLHEYPFTPKNIEIRIWIYNHDKSKLTKEKIYYISSLKGIISFTNHLNPYQPIHEETYEEALKIYSSE